ncbi:hypothetical protein A2U01_0081696 [Trifolium medium]|uniref:Uncharacterized protein n=1 Tax=Trifolium medium TaxID=97028 RepID=A0A392TJZ5_9FABA|nr:hypothetical protein [Trifolium medium]
MTSQLRISSAGEAETVKLVVSDSIHVILVGIQTRGLPESSGDLTFGGPYDNRKITG